MDVPYPRKLYEDIRKGNPIDFRELVKTGMVISFFTYDLDKALEIQNGVHIRAKETNGSLIVIDEKEEQKWLDRFLEINKNNDSLDMQGFNELFTKICFYSPFYSKYQDYENPRIASKILSVNFENHTANYLVIASHPDLIDDQRLEQYADSTIHRMKAKLRELVKSQTKQQFQDVFITIDDIESFSEVQKFQKTENRLPIKESHFKKGIQNILNEIGTFSDWGGEKNDLLTTNLKLHGKRMLAAFAFKGRGVSGRLTPNKMGQNGDQIHRLFQSSAEVFLLQYWDQISQEVIEQMRMCAQVESVKQQKKIYWGIIDGTDTYRIYEAYKDKFPSDLIE